MNCAEAASTDCCPDTNSMKLLSRANSAAKSTGLHSVPSACSAAGPSGRVETILRPLRLRPTRSGIAPKETHAKTSSATGESDSGDAVTTSAIT